MSNDWIKPDWPAPANIRAITTTRSGGVSLPPYDTLNLADHVGDNQAHVIENRRRLIHELNLPAEPRWLKQVHSTRVSVADDIEPDSCEGDATYTSQHNTVCVVLTADCLPILLCDKEGTRVAAIHAGWRGLLDGVIESTIEKMSGHNSELMAWFGPAIGPDVFEVGHDVRDAFLTRQSEAAEAFTPAIDDRWLANLYLLASQRLAGVGISEIYGGDLCTYSDPLRFYSYRRDGVTGRMASLIWIAPDVS